MELEYIRQLVLRAEREKAGDLESGGQERGRGSLTVLKEFSTTQEERLMNFPGPAQTNAPDICVETAA
jgi:hypothetical protein